jgi:signal transduction histidine kinase
VRAVREAVEQIGDEIANLRALISELRPAALDELGLVPAIETLAERTATAEGLTVETNIDLGLEAGARLDLDVESALYRLAQEALTNVVKHARASRVEMTLTRDGKNIELTIADDGVGFDPNEEGDGFGLVGMRERAMLAGGGLTIDSSPEGGTTLRASVPARFRDRQVSEERILG